MSLSDDDELDGILDSALDGFDVKEQPSSPAPSASDAETTAKAPPDAAHDAATADALRAFEEALKPLETAGSGISSSGPGEEEDDVKLIAEFIKSFETLAPLAPPSDPASASSADAVSTDGAPGIEGAIKSMIDSVLSKDILQEPMTQIRTSLRAWLDKQGDALSTEERARHEGQLETVVKICGEYEGDTDAGRVIDLLAKLRESGTLPKEVMDDLPDDGGDMGVPGMEEVAAGCPMQ